MLTVERIRIIVEIDFYDDPDEEIQVAIDDLDLVLRERVDIEEYLEGSIGICSDNDWTFDVRDAAG